MKKTVSLILALLMVLSMVSGMTFASAETEPKGHIKQLMGYCATDPNEEPPAAMIEELTGFEVTYYMLPSDGADAKLNLELSSGTEYDLIRMSKNQFYTLAPKGAFVDIESYLEPTTYLKDIMSDFEWSAAKVDGKLYGIPQFDAYYVSNSLVINTRIYEEAGFVLDTTDRQITVDEWVEVARKIKENGVIPFTSNSAIDSTFASAFGIVNHDFQFDTDGSVVPTFLHSNMKDYISFMHDLYVEGLIDAELPVNKHENVDQKFTSGLAASMTHGWVITTEVNSLKETTGDDVGYLYPLANAEGEARLSANKGVTAYGAIPTSCKQVETVIEFLDLRSEPETFLKSFLGVEGEQWEFRDTNNDGVQEYWPILDREPGFTPWFNGHYFNMVNSPASFTDMWLARARKGAIQYAATEAINTFPSENWVDSPLAYAPPMEAVSQNTQSLNALTNDYILECIAGTRSVDEYDAVVAEFLADGGQDMIDEVSAYVEANPDILTLNAVANIQSSNIYN